MEEQRQYESISKFDRRYSGLVGGNNLPTRATTIEDVNALTGETETYVVQTIRDERGDHIVLKVMDKDGLKRLILPPRVANLIAAQHDGLTRRRRSIVGKAQAKSRMERGEVPAFLSTRKVPA